MRWFVSLMFLTNLALAGLLYWQSEVTVPAAVSAEHETTKRLKLLSELSQQTLKPIPHTDTPAGASLPMNDAEIQPVVTPAEEGGIAESQVTCLRISHMASTADVAKLRQKLVQANHSVLESGEEFIERQTYWVMIPPYKTDKAARDAAALLARAKVRDFLVIRTGEFEKGISLGLFSLKEGAESRVQEILALKLNVRKPEIKLRAASVRSHWLLAQVGNEEGVSLQQKLEAEGLKSSPVVCTPN